MDLKKKGKAKFPLKLNVQLDSISPEIEHPVSVSSTMVNTDLFFSEPIALDV